MNVAGLIIQLASGAVGGNVAGAVLKKFSLGTVGNSIVGILGGGGQAGGGLDLGSIVSSIAGGGVGGGVLMAIVGVIRNMMSKSS
jgi:hypothetical protein